MELHHIGKRCEYSYCKQLDFLPFKCNSCPGEYCFEHRKVQFHGPECAAEKDIRMAICLHCQTSLGKTETQEQETLVIKKHLELNQCSKVKASAKKPAKCQFGRCSTKLFVSKINCSGCSREFCLKHRFPEDHRCSSTLVRDQNFRKSPQLGYVKA